MNRRLKKIDLYIAPGKHLKRCITVFMLDRGKCSPLLNPASPLCRRNLWEQTGHVAPNNSETPMYLTLFTTFSLQYYKAGRKYDSVSTSLCSHALKGKVQILGKCIGRFENICCYSDDRGIHSWKGKSLSSVSSRGVHPMGRNEAEIFIIAVLGGEIFLPF